MDIKQIIGLVIAIILVIAFIIYIAWKIKKEGLRQFATDFIVKAEEIYKQGQNNEKMLFVIEKIKAVLGQTKVGKIISIFITDYTIEKFIQNVFDSVKKALDYIPKKEG